MQARECMNEHSPKILASEEKSTTTTTTTTSVHWQQAPASFLPYGDHGSFRDEGLKPFITAITLVGLMKRIAFTALL